MIGAMDVSAADHRAGSDLDIPVEFWEEFDRIVDVDRPGGDQQEGGSSNGEAHSEAAVVVALLQERITRLLVLCNAWYGECCSQTFRRNVTKNSMPLSRTYTALDAHLQTHT
jgi:hypothetical protein